MAASEGAVDVRIGAPGPWAQRRIAFHATSTYASSPAMEPLNQPVTRVETGANGVGGAGHHQLQQQYHQNQQMCGAGVSGKPGKSEPLSLPSSMPLQWTAPQKIGAGLSNLGNTCFLNSVLQCLTYTPPLAGYLQSGQHKASCRVAGFCAFCALQEHVQQALASSGKVVSPQKLAKNLRSICRSFRMGRQEDSHEYMRYLLDALHKCCLPPDLAKNSNSKSSQEKSLVYRIFGGRLRSQVKCTVCSHCSDTYDPFLDLSLEIVRADSLTKALTRFTAVDVLDGDNKYRCLRCKKKVRALKNFTIDSVPNILTIQFKRFRSTSGQGGKIDKKVEFETTLDLKPFVSNGQDNVPKYKLFGVLVHSGWSTHSGHYYSFLRASSDIWHVFDDTRVRQVSEKTVLEQKAYMLFYVREVKRATISCSDIAPTKQALLPRQLTVLAKERKSNCDSGVAPRQALSPFPSALSKEREGKHPDEVLPKQSSSDPINFLSKNTESNGHVVALSKPALSQAGGESFEVTGHNPVQTNSPKGLICAPAVIPTVNGSGHHVAAAVPPVLSSTCLDEPAVGLCLPAADHCVPAKDHESSKEMEIDSCCTTRANPGCEDDWDEFYKKGWNPPGSTPQNFLKMLRTIPHTRRYYQARACPLRRASKIASNGNGELENGNPELLESLAAIVNKVVKRPSVNEDFRGAKRQQRESGVSTVSNTCMALKEFSKTDAMDIAPSSGHISVVQDTVGQEVGLPERIEAASGGNAFLPGLCSRSKVGGDLNIVERLLVMTGENGVAESNGHVNIAQGHVKESLNHRELQHSGAELRVESVENNCQALDTHDWGPEHKTHTNGSTPENHAKTLTGPSNGTVIPMARSNLYGDSVSRWSDVDGNESSLKEIDRLLEAEKGGSFKQDIWDEEYDRGRSKKVRTKTSRETHGTDISSSGTGNGVLKPSNPFQAFGTAKKIVHGIKQGNSIGFKAGYGYGLKTGKNVGITGSQSMKSA